MNPRIFVGAAASVLITIIVVFWLFASDVEGGFFSPSTQEVLKHGTNLQLTLILDDGDTFGSEIGLMEDFDNDGTNDIVIGASGDDDGGLDRGAVYILFLNKDGTVKEYQKIPNLIN